MIAGLANAAVTNYFPNGRFDSPAGARGAWIEVYGGGTTTYSYPTTGGNPSGYGVMNNASGWGIWVGQTSSTEGYALAPLGLVAGGNYNFVMDMKNFSGAGVGKLKIECWAGGVPLDTAVEIPASGQSGNWATYTFNRTLAPGTTSIMIVPVAGAGSQIGFDNIGVIAPGSAPTVAITSPFNGAALTPDFVIDATAATSSGTITNVRFFDGASVLGNDTAAPYSLSVTGATLGAHALTAIAQASTGSSATSAVVNVTVSSPAPGGSWQLVWSDEFNGTGVDTGNWTFEVGNGSGGWGNNERQYYTSRTNNASVSGGVLRIIARQENFGGFPYTSARMKSQGKFSKKYGRIEFRTKLPPGVGCWPANWMMPETSAYGGWAASGEIDVMESRGSDLTKVEGTIHYGGSWPNNVYSGTSYTLPGGGLTTNFHTYMIEWTTNSLKWFVDGVLYQTQTNWYSTGFPYPAPFDQPFYLIMNLAIGGNYLGNPSDAAINAGTPFPVEMQVDYVRVYDYQPGPPATPTGLTASPGNSKAYLRWENSGGTGYLVKRAPASGGPYTTVATVADNEHTDTGFDNCTTYYYVVSATNSLGTSSNSTEAVASLGAFALAVNSGGTAAGHFGGDAYVSGGTVGAVSTAAINVSGLQAPAPQAVYQAERYGNFTYTFTGLTPGANYLVRLHSAETYWTTVGQRRFNVAINGTQVLTNFDIIAAAGAPNKAVISEFNAAASGGQIVVAYTTVTDNARASGIEVLLSQPAAPAGLAASPGNAEIALSWSPTAGAQYSVKRALASGGPYTPVTAGLNVTNFTNTGLTNGVTYHYVVSATLLGCESANSAFISATPACTPPAPPNAGNNGPLWEGMTLNLTASTVPGATYQWSGPNGFNSTNQNPTLANATTNDAGLFSVTASAGGCTSAPSLTTVTVNPPAQITAQTLSGNIILTWPGGTLQSATNISGFWSDVIGATSPRTNAMGELREFYRIRLQ